MSQSYQELARTFRAESGQILAVLIKYCRDIDLAEEALQAAFCQAAEQWPDIGVPQNQSGWLYTAAKRKLIDAIRHNAHRNNSQNQHEIYRSLYESIDSEDSSYADERDFAIPEERLRLIFTCCHPALSPEARVSLTLKTLCGLSVREIARAYLTSEVAMEKRLTRAKGKIRDAGIRYEIPTAANMEDRVDSVLSVIYLIYNESYSAFEGQSLTRADFAKEAIRLARLLYALLPLSNAAGLLALLLLHDSRRPARYSPELGFIALENQDRELWQQGDITEGIELLESIVTAGVEGKTSFDIYTIQAAISALHCKAVSWQQTDWTQIEKLYRELYKTDPSPIVLLNHALVLLKLGRHSLAFAQVNELQPELEKYQPFYVARATIAESVDMRSLAIADYSRAIELSTNKVEKAHLQLQLKQLETRK